MSKSTDLARMTTAIRDLDPARATKLTSDEVARANATRERILQSSAHVEPRAPRAPRHSRTLIPAGLVVAAAGAIAIPAVFGGTAFASWTRTPAPLSKEVATAAAATCRSALDLHDPAIRVVVAERRGGWSYVLTDGPEGEAACLMPDELIGVAGRAAQKSGFFGSYEADAPEAPVPDQNGLVQNESTQGAVSLPGPLSLGTIDGWFAMVSGYVGADVVGVTVSPPTGPEVEASLHDGRFAAWWPAGVARGDNPGVSGSWTYTLTLSNGTTRKVAPN